jgi:hypothetical protein
MRGGSSLSCRLPVAANQIPHSGLELLGGAGLLEHEIAARALRASGIRREGRIPGDGENGHATRSRILFEPAGQLESIDPGNVQIGDHDVGKRFERPFERLKSVVRLMDAEARLSQPLRVQSAAVAVVFNQQHAGASVVVHQNQQYTQLPTAHGRANCT